MLNEWCMWHHFLLYSLFFLMSFLLGAAEHCLNERMHLVLESQMLVFFFLLSWLKLLKQQISILITCHEFQNSKWTKFSLLLNIQQNYTIKHQKIQNNCFGSKKHIKIFGQVKIDKHECQKITATYKTKYKGKI